MNLRKIGLIKSRLEASAEKGYSAYDYKIETDSPDEKVNFEMYVRQGFIDYLNKHLVDVTVEYDKKFIENIFSKEENDMNTFSF